MQKNTITVIILTKNEEVNIVAAIKNAQKVSSDVLVIDSGSTDKTVELAKENGARVVYRAWDNDFSAQRNFALKNTEAEWVLYLDADEEMNEQLIASINKMIAGGAKQAMYRFIRRTSAFGKDFKYGVLGTDSVLRLFPRTKVTWENKVHERPVGGDLPVITLDGYLKHYTYRDFDQYQNKMSLYSTIWADNNQGKKVNLLKDIVLKPGFAFFKMYILKKGFLEGWLGFVLCLNYANYTLNKYVKLKLLRKGE